MKQEAMLELKSRCFEYLWRHRSIFFLVMGNRCYGVLCVQSEVFDCEIAEQ